MIINELCVLKDEELQKEFESSPSVQLLIKALKEVYKPLNGDNKGQDYGMDRYKR